MAQDLVARAVGGWLGWVFLGFSLVANVAMAYAVMYARATAQPLLTARNDNGQSAARNDDRKSIRNDDRKSMVRYSRNEV